MYVCLWPRLCVFPLRTSACVCVCVYGWGCLCPHVCVRARPGLSLTLAYVRVLCLELGLPLTTPCACARPGCCHSPSVTAPSPLSMATVGFFLAGVQQGCPSHDRGVGQAGPWARVPGRGGAGVRDHFHQPVIGLVYLRQQVRQPVPVGPSAREASKWQSCQGPSRGNGPPSLLSSQM